jgi:broad specificity phosphatase PhoE
LGWALAAGTASAQQTAAPLLNGHALVGALRQGGFVIYLRHAETEPSAPDSTRIDMNDCTTQRNLSERGREQARQIGLAFTALGIRVAKVFSSPYCRCLDTGRLAFGSAEISQALYFSVGSEPQTRARQAAELRRLLAAPPPPGANVVLVSHTANLKEATGIWPKPEAVAHVFRPEPGGGFTHVARIEPEEWPRLAAGGGAR